MTPRIELTLVLLGLRRAEAKLTHEKLALVDVDRRKRHPSRTMVLDKVVTDSKEIGASMVGCEMSGSRCLSGIDTHKGLPCSANVMLPGID